MRKEVSILVAILLLILPVLAIAEDTSAPKTGGMILTGKVEAHDTLTVTAPFGGVALDHALKAGERVSAGDTLFVLDTAKILAPCDGVITGVFAQIGDSAQFVQSRYGGLCFMEPTVGLAVQSNTAQGYDSAENRLLHIGQTVYLRSTNSAHDGTGRITAISGEAYSVEVLSGTLQLRDSVTLYRDAAFSPDTRIGRGTVARVNPISVTGDGIVFSILAKDGAKVSRGDVLFETVSGVADPMAAMSPEVAAPVDGIVAGVSVSGGQTVQKGQAVATLYTLSMLRLVSTVSELDIGKVRVGDAVRIELDALPDTAYAGEIVQISSIGTVSDQYTQYAVYIDFVPDGDVRLGMSGAAYPVN